MRNFKPVYLFLLIILSQLTGCMGGAPVPQDHYYRLANDNAKITSTFKLTHQTIGVLPAVAHGLYLERSILYVDTNAPMELQQYHYHHWHDAPSRIIQEHIIDWLKQRAGNTTVVRLNRGEQTEIMLNSRIVHFERNLTRNGLEVLVELELSLDKKYNIIQKKTYRYAIKLKGNTMHDTIDAFGKALTEIYTAFLNDLKPANS